MRKAKYVIDADIVCDISKKTEEEIFGKDSIRDHGVEDSKNPDAPGYQKYTVTGSQAGAVLGLSKWQSPLTLWAEKRGQEIVTPAKDEEILKAGHAAEDFVANMFARKMKEDFGDRLESVEIVDDTNMYRSKKNPFMVADLDRIAILTFKSGSKKVVGLECKTVYNVPAIKGWKEGLVPPTYEAQCRHYMAVTNLSAWYICACWGFTINDCAIVLFRRDTEKEEALIEAEKTFIECCEEGIEPAIPEENVELTTQYYNAIYGGLKSDTVAIELNTETEAILNDSLSIADLEAQKKTLDKQITELKNSVAARLIKITSGGGKSFSLERGDTKYLLNLKVPTKSDTVNMEELLKERPETKDNLVEIGLGKITKTDLGKVKIDGKKVDFTPYIVAGETDLTKPIELKEVKTFTMSEAS